ncbi:hypothetical protein A6R68_08543 [Neotoma lepida]|uniref:ATCAY kinesin light chain interacting caytaxin n=1 Tax=Neotoma lepida TaxID=56216 RepID=A0A1A6G279_NEOLE|nr:hypothetical protein A6R68_08543 [Neotoma lepida]
MGDDTPVGPASPRAPSSAIHGHTCRPVIPGCGRHTPATSSDIQERQIRFGITQASSRLLFPAPMGTTEATLRMENVDVRDEWQDEDLPSGAHRKRKTLVAPEINISLDQSEGSLLSDDFLDTPDDLDINVDDIETPDETDSLEFLGNGNELEWEDDTPVATAKNMPGDSADLFGDSAADDGGAANGRLWRTVIIGEQEHRIDLHMIRPYMKVVTHGGYYGEGLNAIIVYVISSLELLVAEDYMIVYLNGATPRRRMPGIGWLKKCYHMIDRR